LIARRHLLGLFLVVTACGGPSAEEIASAVPASSSFLAAMRPADLGRDVEAVQLVTVSRAGKAITVELRLSIKADRLMFVAQDMLGQRLMTVQWSEVGVSVERSPNLPEGVSPVGMLADLVAICWPADAVRPALQKQGATLIEQDGQRIVLFNRRETLRATLGWPATRWTGRMSYRNVKAGYTVDVQSVEQL
jgi:hypothetical protein